MTNEAIQELVLCLAKTAAQRYAENGMGSAPEAFIQHFCADKLLDVGLLATPEIGASDIRKYLLPPNTDTTVMVPGRTDMIVYRRHESGNPEDADACGLIEFKRTAGDIESDARRTRALLAHAYPGVFGYVIVAGTVLEDATKVQGAIIEVKRLAEKEHYGPVTALPFTVTLPGIKPRYGAAIGLSVARP